MATKQATDSSVPNSAVYISPLTLILPLAPLVSFVLVISTVANASSVIRPYFRTTKAEYIPP